MSDIKELVFTDAETTAKCGPDTTDDQLIEVAAVRVRLADRKVISEFTTLIKPHGTYQTVFTDGAEPVAWDLGEYHVKARHFADVDWSSGMCLAEALKVLAQDFFPGATLTGSNVPFDVRHYKRDFAAVGLDWPNTDYHMIDLSSPAIYLYMEGKIPGVSLRYTSALAGRPKQKHRALSDCYDGIAAFWAMYDFFCPGNASAGSNLHTNS